MKKVSPEVKSFLEWLAINKIVDLFSQEAVTLIRRGSIKKKRSELADDEKIRADRLFNQLPAGIYVDPKEVIDLILNFIKSMTTDSLSYSPMTLTFNEFKSCKLMKFFSGNIITGRDKEIETILLALSKKDKRGSILIGDPGTGKTAIVQAINARLIARTVPRQLIGCYIVNMDVQYILSKNKEDPIGTIIGILEKASEYDKVILFIDEVHQLLGQRMNDILKPYLTEKIRFIGSTTASEFHSIITEDAALERRFTIVHVLEPNTDETTKMVIGTKSVYENHHKCSIPDNICKYLVEVGNRFLGTRKNPDKSFDVLDFACSIMCRNEIETKYTREKQSGNFFEDIDIKRRELSSQTEHAGNKTLTKEYVDLAISSLTGVDYTEIINSTSYTGVLSSIKEEIFGQDTSLEKLANFVNVFKATKSDRIRPISVLLMVGPPGCGKKSSSKLLAKKLFGNPNYFIEFDMSGLGAEFALTELKGAPPGYVGYSKSGGLIKAVRNKPLSVLYFRSINLAHQTIQKYIVEGCRAGKLTDSAEREAKLNNTIVIFSITLDPESFSKLIKGAGKTMGFGKIDEIEEKVPKKALSQIVGSDIVDLCDDILIFNQLDIENLEKIYNANVDKITKNYNVDIDKQELHRLVMTNSKNGHDVVSKLSSEVPRLVFQKLSQKEKENEIKISKSNISDDRNSVGKGMDSKPNRRTRKPIQDSKEIKSPLQSA